MAQRRLDASESTDADLVVALQAGDQDAFAELFRRHHAVVRRVCARRLGSISDADEVAQAAFVRAYERIDQCAGERRFGAWVQVIAVRMCTDMLRGRNRVAADAVPADLPSKGVGPEDAVLRDERATAVHAALSMLPDRQRQVMVARHLEGRGPGEIAAALGLSLGAVDSLLLRAKRRLATVYASSGAETGAATVGATSGVAAATATAPTLWQRIAAPLASAMDAVSTRFAGAFGIGSSGSAQAVERAGAIAIAGALGLGALTLGTGAATQVPVVPDRLPAVEAPAVTAPSTPTAPETEAAAGIDVERELATTSETPPPDAQSMSSEGQAQAHGLTAAVHEAIAPAVEGAVDAAETVADVAIDPVLDAVTRLAGSLLLR